jgi:hypothetical protein
MRLNLATALLLASVTAAQAQLQTPNQSQNTGGSTPASQMAGRAAANANQVRDAAANGMASLYTSPESDQPSATQRVIRGPANSQLNGTPSDPVLHYPYGRYGASLGNVNPNSLANPFTRGAPAPFATTSGTQGFHRGR